MEAAKPRRAAFRLAVLAGGVLLTVALVAASARLLAGRSGDAIVAEAEPLIVAPDWQDDPVESYRLPVVSASVPPTPARVEPILPDYEPPIAAPPKVAPIESPDASQAAGWRGPVTIHNPAALGPPEDDSLPPIPTAAPAVAANPSPRLAMRGDIGPILPAPAAEAAEPALGSSDSFWVDPSEEASIEDTEAPRSDAERVARVYAEQAAGAALRDMPAADRDELLRYTAAVNGISQRLTPEVQAGFQLGKAGAAYAARSKFVGVLRQVALAKDAEEGSTRHTEALAEGLRTLDEADDFIPRGDALEAELDVAAIARSHRVRLVGVGVTPHDAAARYSRHSAKKLAEAAGGEQAASMALYGLGKTYARMEAQHKDETAGRKSTVMYQAAIGAHDENYLAANELGVRLARAGRYEQAAEVLRTAARQPAAIAMVHANLAMVEKRLGNPAPAIAAMEQSRVLSQAEHAAGEVSRRHGVQWVSPQAFGAGTGPGAPHPIAQTPVPVQPSAPTAAPAVEEEGSWSRWVRKAKEATGFATPTPSPQPTPWYGAPRQAAAPTARVVR